MAGKGSKKRNSKDSTGSKEKKKGGKKKNGRATGGGSSAKSSKIQGDIFSEGAMENAYLICHNVQVIIQVVLYNSVLNLYFVIQKYLICDAITIFYRMY